MCTFTIIIILRFYVYSLEGGSTNVVFVTLTLPSILMEVDSYQININLDDGVLKAKIIYQN